MNTLNNFKNWKTLFSSNKNTTNNTTKQEGVVVHFYVPLKMATQNLCINPNCFLIDNYEGEKVELLKGENIATAPQFTAVPAQTAYQFTLHFSALPAQCTGFDILEDVATESGLFIPHVKRNASDIYHIHLQ